MLNRFLAQPVALLTYIGLAVALAIALDTAGLNDEMTLAVTMALLASVFIADRLTLRRDDKTLLEKIISHFLILMKNHVRGIKLLKVRSLNNYLQFRISHVGPSYNVAGIFPATRLVKKTGNDIVLKWEDALPQIAHAIQSQVEKKHGNIKVLGICAKEFLHADGFSVGPNQSLCLWLSSKLQDPSYCVNIDILILNPRSQIARERHKLERFPQLLADLSTSEKNCLQLIRMSPQSGNLSNRLRLGLYNDLPRQFIVLTEEVAFVEDYLARPPSNWEGGCFEHMLPVRRYLSESQGYEAAIRQVERLEKDKKTCWT